MLELFELLKVVLFARFGFVMVMVGLSVDGLRCRVGFGQRRVYSSRSGYFVEFVEELGVDYAVLLPELEHARYSLAVARRTFAVQIREGFAHVFREAFQIQVLIFF